LFPLNGLSGVMKVITTIDPLTYGVDGLRGTLVGASHFGLLTDFSVLIIIMVLLLGVGSYLFSKIQI